MIDFSVEICAASRASGANGAVRVVGGRVLEVTGPGERALVAVKAYLREMGRRDRPTCFVSYAWGEPDHMRWVERLAEDLRNSYVTVILDQWENLDVGANLSRFVERLDASNFVAVIATPAYRLKYDVRQGSEGRLLTSEMALVNKRIQAGRGAPQGVLPILRADSPEESLPPLLQDRVFADFRDDASYFASLFELVMTIHHVPRNRAPFNDLWPGVVGATT